MLATCPNVTAHLSPTQSTHLTTVTSSTSPTREWSSLHVRLTLSHTQVIVTSYLFPSGTYAPARLTALLTALDNDTSKLVIDLSCRRKGKSWFVATDKWQTVTDFEITFGECLCSCL